MTSGDHAVLDAGLPDPLTLTGIVPPSLEEISEAAETSTQPAFLLLLSRGLTPQERRFVRQSLSAVVGLHDDDQRVSLRLPSADIVARPELVLQLVAEMERGGRKLRRSQDDVYDTAQEAARAANQLLARRQGAASVHGQP